MLGYFELTGLYDFYWVWLTPSFLIELKLNLIFLGVDYNYYCSKVTFEFSTEVVVVVPNNNKSLSFEVDFNWWDEPLSMPVILAGAPATEQVYRVVV